MAKNEDVKPIFSENIFQTLNVEEDEIVKAQDISFGFNSIINNISLALNTIFSGVGNTRDFVLGGKITVDEAALQPAIKISPLLCYSGKKRQSVIIPTTSSIQFTPSSKDESYIILIHLIEVNIDTRDRYKSTISATSDELKTDIASISIVKQFRGEIVALEENTDIEKDEYIKIAEVTVTAPGEVHITGLERQEEWSKKGETN